MKKKLCALLLAVLIMCMARGIASGEAYQYPCEDGKHEGTWLIWPHDYAASSKNIQVLGISFRDFVEDVWVETAKALHTGENIHIIAFDEDEKAHISQALEAENVDMNKIDFLIYPTNDVWVRDTGPIFVLDENGKILIADFEFDGWGKKQRYDRDNGVPQAVADAYGFDIVQIPDMVLEGGAVECDGSGTLMASKSSVVSANRNQDKTLEEVEAILAKYLGVENFIWIEGAIGEDITDAHIDATARFINDGQIFICSKEEYAYLYLTDTDESDWAVFENAVNAKGDPYELVHLPLTKNPINLYGIEMDLYGCYTNYYIGNEAVLVPQFNDPNDALAIEIIKEHYPDRRIVGIDCSMLILFGGGIHCITQQQPLADAG